MRQEYVDVIIDQKTKAVFLCGTGNDVQICL